MTTQENIQYTADEIKAMVKTIEELRKKYKDALERAKGLWEQGMMPERIEYIFPELKESEDEDEKIRKAIIAYINNGQHCGVSNVEMLAWFKKQGEKKPANKVEPKFNVGDWITNGCLTCKVLGVTGNSYELHLYNDDYCHFETDIQSVDKYYHLWTIHDAMDGDVLVYVTDEEDLWIMIYWSLYEPYEGHVHYHALLVNDNFSDKGTCCICIDNLKPSTKEQRDLLFSKMKEAGCEWDSEKKELKKIEVASKESEDERIRKEILNVFNQLDEGTTICGRNYDYAKWIAWLEKQGNKSVNIDVESMVSSYEQRLESQGGTKYTPLVNMCLTAFRHGVKNVLEELNLKKLEKQGDNKECDEEWEVTTGLYKCTKRMFDGSPENRLWFEIGSLYKCVSKDDIAEFESSYGHNVFLIDPVVREHFIKV